MYKYNKMKINEGTNNFALDNASKYYVIADPGEDDEDGYGYDMDEVISDLAYELKKVADFTRDLKVDVPNQNRNFFSIPLGTVTKSFSVTEKLQNDYGKYDKVDNTYYVTIYCYANAGYYSGANLDFKVIVEDDLYNTYDDSDYSECPKVVSSYITKKYSEIEKVYATISDPHTKVGGFSDGTAVYSRSK